MCATTRSKSSKPAADFNSDFPHRLLEWYRRSQRRLPWRGSRNPYAIWVAEIMLQQTRVETVIPYFERWMAQFPSLAHLAQASEQQVLTAWEGLGYYSRARNLHRAAKMVVEQFGGSLPDTLEGLMRLPGIGRYTAGAIAAIAFGQDEIALDGNLRRVISRLFDVALPARSSQGERRIAGLLRAHLPVGQAEDFNQALMDLGATLCTPRRPRCAECPLSDICRARALGIQEQRPLLPRRAPVPHITVAAAVIQRGSQVLITRRPSNGLLGGLWEFPGGKQEAGETLPDCLLREIREELGVEIAVGSPLGVYQHAYSHFKVTLHAFTCHLLEGEPQALQVDALEWAHPRQLSAYPMGKIDRQIAERLADAG